MNRAVNLLGWLGTLAVVVALVIGGVPLFGVPPLGKPEWAPYAWYIALAGLVLIVLYLATQWREAAQWFSHRNARLGSIAVGSVLVVLAILVFVNILANRRSFRWDLTANQVYSLSPQTTQLLQKLDAPVQALVFAKPADFDTYRDRLDQYAAASKGRLSVQYINPDREPAKAQQNKIESYGTVVFNYKGRSERVVGSDEQQLTNSLIKVVTGAQRTVYFLEGHGERDTSDGGRDGYQSITQSLGSENYKTDSLALAQKGKVPDDATVLIVAGPRTDLLAPEIDAIKTYLNRGGKLFVMIEPELTGQQPTPNLLALTKEWGFDVGNNIVVDTNPVGQLLGTGELAPVAARYPSHPIVANFRLLTAYPTARSVRPVQGGTNGRTPQSFIETSEAAWGETDIKAIIDQQPVGADKDKDVMGPVGLGAALNLTAPSPPPAPKNTADAPKPETRIAVIGDSDFASNSYLGIRGNRDMFLNVVNWLAQQENLISIRPHDPEDRRLTMTTGAQRFVTWLALLIVPAAIFGAGVYSWSRRRG